MEGGANGKPVAEGKAGGWTSEALRVPSHRHLPAISMLLAVPPHRWPHLRPHRWLEVVIVAAMLHPPVLLPLNHQLADARAVIAQVVAVGVGDLLSSMLTRKKKKMLPRSRKQAPLEALSR